MMEVFVQNDKRTSTFFLNNLFIFGLHCCAQALFYCIEPLDESETGE